MKILQPEETSVHHNFNTSAKYSCCMTSFDGIARTVTIAHYKHSAYRVQFRSFRRHGFNPVLPITRIQTPKCHRYSLNHFSLSVTLRENTMCVSEVQLKCPSKISIYLSTFVLKNGNVRNDMRVFSGPKIRNYCFAEKKSKTQRNREIQSL